MEQLLLRNRPGEKSLSCPNCRKVTPIPEDGAKRLEPAFQINNLLEIREGLKKKGAEGDATAVAPSYCPDHGDEKVKLYCKTCEKLICYKCVIKEAKHHKCSYEVLSKLRGRYKEEILVSLDPVKKNLTSVEQALEKFEVCHGEISDQRAVRKASIKNTIQQLHETLEAREKELIKELDQVTDGKLESLATQTDQVKSIQLKLMQCQADVEEKLKTSNDRELVGGKVRLVKNIGDSKFDSDILIPRERPDIKFTISPEATAMCQKYGKLSVGDTIPLYSVSGNGLSAATVGEEAMVVLKARNPWGDPIAVPLTSLHVKLVSEINGTTVLSSTIQKRKDVEIKYEPTIHGRHQFYIAINGQHIKGSPFNVKVKSKLSENILAKIKVQRPWGIAINHKNVIVVTEHNNHCVSVFHPNGEKLQSCGTIGDKLGQFTNPRGVTLDDEGHILVADYKNHRIQKFTADGTFLAAVGSKGSGKLEFKGPKGIAFSTFNKRVYVVDENYRVQVLYNSNFSFHSVFGV